MDVLITDLHFGVKNNSMTWFNSQMSFFKNQFIPYIKEHHPDRLICLGDVFDIRSTISTLIAHEVHKLFIEISSIVPTYIIAGNHDFYSPVEDTYCTLETVLHDIDNCTLVVRDVLDLGDCVLVPWFIQEREGISNMSSRYSVPIFTHADIIMGSPVLNTKVYSGHVHTPHIRGNCNNLGSCFPLTFADSNAARYFYVLDNEKLTAIKNEHSIRFWRFRGDEILEDPRWPKVKSSDYIELYIESNRLIDPVVIDRISSLTKRYRNIWTIPQQTALDSEPIDVDCNIHEIIDSLVPDELREKFEYIKTKIDVNS